MRIAKNDVPIKIDAAGAVARQLKKNQGDAAALLLYLHFPPCLDVRARRKQHLPPSYSPAD
jgi:hypothetical protein